MPTDKLHSPQEASAQAVAIESTASDAYCRAFPPNRTEPSSIHAMASQFLGTVKVRLRVAEPREEIRRRVIESVAIAKTRVEHNLISVVERALRLDGR